MKCCHFISAFTQNRQDIVKVAIAFSYLLSYVYITRVNSKVSDVVKTRINKTKTKTKTLSFKTKNKTKTLWPKTKTKTLVQDSS